MKFSYLQNINVLNQEEKIAFYLTFANRLTTANRNIWSDDSFSLAEQIDAMKWTNEVMHRVLNRLDDLVMERNDFSDEDIWNLIKQHASQNKITRGAVGYAIEKSYNQVIESRTKQYAAARAGDSEK